MRIPGRRPAMKAAASALVAGLLVLPSGSPSHAQSSEQADEADTGASAPAHPEAGTYRRAGDSADGVMAAVDLSQAAFPDGAARQVVVAGAHAFPDSLSAAALAGTRGPVLLTPAGQPQLAPAVRAEITRVLDPRADCAADPPQIWIVGGADVLPGSIEEEIATLGFCADRLAGASRVETSVLVAEQTLQREPSTRVVLASADSWADAAAGTAWAANAGVPIVLTGGEALHPAAERFLREHRFMEAILLGGPAALSYRVELFARQYGATRRIAGDSREATAVEVARRLWKDTDGVVLVNAWAENGWAHATAVAPLAAREAAPVLYARRDGLPLVTRSHLEATDYGFAVYAGPEELLGQLVEEEVRHFGRVEPESCAEQHIAFPDDDISDRTAKQSVAGVELRLDDERGCEVVITQQWTVPGQELLLYAAIWLDTDADRSTGCEGGELVAWLEQERTRLYATRSCDRSKWQESSAPLRPEVGDQGWELRYDIAALPPETRVLTELVDIERTQDYARDDRDQPLLTPVLAD